MVEQPNRKAVLTKVKKKKTLTAEEERGSRVRYYEYHDAHGATYSAIGFEKASPKIVSERLVCSRH
jgi:hypothetical protein